MPGRSGEPVVTMLVCLLSFRIRGCGCIKRPASPRPLLSEGWVYKAKLARKRAARTRRCVWMSLRAKRSNPSYPAKKEWIASSQGLLAMTMVRVNPRCDSDPEQRYTAHNSHHNGADIGRCRRYINP